MKYALGFCFAFVLASGTALQARDLSYKIGFGYEQLSTNGFVLDSGLETGAQQLHALSASYGLARDFLVEAKFGFTKNFDSFMVGPSVRYDFQRLLSRNPAAWNRLNIFVKAAFFLKGGDEVKTSATIHAPYLGFEVFPFEDNHFAIRTQAGFVMDLIENSSIGFTQGLLGDLGVSFYF